MHREMPVWQAQEVAVVSLYSLKEPSLKVISTRVVEEISRWFMQTIDPATWLLIGHLMIMLPVKLL